MSLATRCTACGTIFRVVEDQLRVSDGWVRCGRCAEVFDARELLFDIERDAPPPWPVPFTPTGEMEPEPPSLPPLPPPPPPPAPLPPPPPPPSPLPAPAEPTFTAAPSWAHEDPEPDLISSPPQWDEPSARQEPRWVDEDVHVSISSAERSPSGAGLADEPLAPPPLAAEPRPAPVPEFMRLAQSGDRWRRPRVRIALGVTAVVLVLALMLQVMLHFRDALAAQQPALRSALATLCGMAGCEVQPWRRIDALSIESTSLSPVGAANAGYRLNLSLRNKTAVDVAAPWVELSLTDASGAPLARRVLAPAAMSPAIAIVTADSEQALSLNFSTGGAVVSGYSVNVFYP